MSLPRAYEDPHEPGGLDGVEPFAKAHKLKTPDALRILQFVLSYTLHKPRRTRFPTTPTLVFDRDKQRQMDLMDMQKLSRWNKGSQIFVERDRCPVQVCLGRPHQIQNQQRHDTRTGRNSPPSFAAAATPRAEGSRQRTLQCSGSSAV